MKTKTQSVQSTMIQVPLKQVQELRLMSSALLDLAEEILEQQGLYSDTFLNMLTESEADVKASRVYKVASVKEGL